MNKKIEHLNKESTIQNLEDCGFRTKKANKEELINNLMINFEQNGNKFNLQLKWYESSKGQEKY